MTVWLQTTRGAGAALSRPRLRKRAERMLQHLGEEASELSLLLCDDATIRALNLEYREVDAPTDVLSFALEEAPGPRFEGAPRLLGDVIISVERARAQARAQGHAIAYEVTFLLAHGLLHLLGMDHATAEEAAQMNAKTAELMEAAGLPRSEARALSHD